MALMDFAFAIVYLLFWVLPAIFAGLYAREKGYEFAVFFAAGLLFSVFAAVFIALMLPDRVETAPEGPTEPSVERPEPSWGTVLFAVVVFALIVALAATVTD